MISKIIAGGQTGVELAALDTAIKLGIDHGGWTSRGKRNEEGILPEIYALEETHTLGFGEALEKNVSASDGTLVISRNRTTVWTQKVTQTALKHRRQFLHVDFGQYALFEAASLSAAWMSQQQIKAVFVTGLLAGEDAQIYRQTRKVLETAFYLGFVKSDLSPDHRMLPVSQPAGEELMPRSVTAAVEQLQSLLPLKDRNLMANLQPDELDHLHSGLGEYIKQHFGLYGANPELMQSCADLGGLHRPLPDEACAVIVRALWEQLRKTHKLRLVK